MGWGLAALVILVLVLGCVFGALFWAVKVASQKEDDAMQRRMKEDELV